MKKAILVTLVTLLSVAAQANTVIINSSKSEVSTSAIDQVIRLVDKKEAGSSQKKLQIVVTDNGMSTDVSPRYKIYLGYASMAEMGNLSSEFKISENAYRVISASRISAGKYEVKTQEYRDEDGFVDVTLSIDATQMFIDENAKRKACGSDFCDGEITTSIKVTESVQKSKN